MTDQELDKLFKSALDHPVKGADANSAWTEANAMIRSEMGIGLSRDQKIQWTVGASMAAFVLGLLLLDQNFTQYQETMVSLPSSERVLYAEQNASNTIEETDVKDLQIVTESSKPARILPPTQAPVNGSQNNSTQFLASTAWSPEPIDPESVLDLPEVEATSAENNELASFVFDPVNLAPIELKNETGSTKQLVYKSLPKADFTRPSRLSSSIALTAGATLSRGAVNDGSEISNTGAFQRFGLMYSKGISERWSVDVGLEYYSMSGKGLELSYDSVNYSFGATRTQHTIRPNSLHYLSMPLQVGFNFSKRHRLSLGGDVAYLMNVKSEMDETRFNAFGQEEGTEQHSTWGYMVGLKNFNFTGSIAYQYSVTEMLDLRAMMNYGLVSIHQDPNADQLNRMRYSLGIVFKLKNFE